MESIINALPSVLNHLSLELPSQTGNDVLQSISKRLHIIKTLEIQSSHELGNLCSDSLLNLGRKCLYLNSFSVTSTKSVSDMLFHDSSAFLMLASFPSLRRICVKYDSISINHLSNLLTQSDSLREVILWERKKWIPSKIWDEMLSKIRSINLLFPCCTVVLENTI